MKKITLPNHPVMVVAVMLFAASGLEYAAADTHYVWRDNPAPVSNYTSWANASTQIQWAVDEATANDTVLVTNGTYDTGGKVTPSYALTNRVMVNKTITVRSVNGAAVTIIKGAPDPGTGGCGSSAVRGVYITAGTLDGFALINGYTWTNNGDATYDRSGAGVLLLGGTVSNCLISQNMANYFGGGAEFFQGGMMNNCTLNCNTSSAYAGGMFFDNGGTMNSCIVSNNRSVAGYGGGAYMVAGTMNNCLLVTNRAAYYGGGIFFSSGSSVLNNCLLLRNSSDLSPGGGAFFNNSGTMNNCTLTESGTGIYMDGSSGVGTLNNCIVWGNPGYDFAINITGAVNYTCSSPARLGPGNTGANPQFVNTNAGNYRLSSNSPGVNTGTNGSWTTNSVDLDGRQRIRYRTVDMGAYETIYQGTVFTVF